VGHRRKYSPDLNPIEQVFAKLKTLVRKAAPRSLDAVSDSIANALRAVSPILTIGRLPCVIRRSHVHTRACPLSGNTGTILQNAVAPTGAI
jgi:hypothetical protein